jgi:RIO-like serine/threonine protein kinase
LTSAADASGAAQGGKVGVVVRSPSAEAVAAGCSVQAQTQASTRLGGSQRDHPANAADKIAVLLQDRASLNGLVVRLFEAITSKTHDLKHLDPRGLRCFRSSLTHHLGMPEEALGDLLTDYVRFDFDGSGRLGVTETCKLVKYHLWEYYKRSGAPGAAHGSTIPLKSLEEAGYAVCEMLGKGSQAVVQLARDRQGNDRCIKCYKKDTLATGRLDMLREEYETMKLMGSPSLAQTFEIFQDAEFVYMVNEVYYGGDFTTLLPRARAQGVCMSEEWWKKLIRQCLQALAFMHQQAMIHCDIKEPNLMLKTENLRHPEVVVVDFGIAKAVGANENGFVSGTPGYMPPETLIHGKWFPRGDVFSLGVVIFQMTADRLPERLLTPMNKGLFLEGCCTLEEVKQATLYREPPLHFMPPHPDLKRFTGRLLEKQLSDRSQAPQALADHWLAGVNTWNTSRC